MVLLLGPRVLASWVRSRILMNALSHVAACRRSWSSHLVLVRSRRAAVARVPWAILELGVVWPAVVVPLWGSWNSRTQILVVLQQVTTRVLALRSPMWARRTLELREVHLVS